MVYLRDGVLRVEHHGRNGDKARELDVTVGVVFDNGEWREVRYLALLKDVFTLDFI